MKKAYVILLFLACLILLTTFTQNSLNYSKNTSIDLLISVDLIKIPNVFT
mgnify:CR=1 FL=1